MSTTLAWRRVARIAAARPGTSAATAELAQSLWLSQGPRKEAPLPRAIARMVAFRAGARHGAVLAVRTTLPGYTCPVPSAAFPFAQLAHRHWRRQSDPRPVRHGPST